MESIETPAFHRAFATFHIGLDQYLCNCLATHRKYCLTLLSLLKSEAARDWIESTLPDLRRRGDAAHGDARRAYDIVHIEVEGLKSILDAMREETIAFLHGRLDSY